ncbi:hypothetical protein MP638_002073 [Amoeboaphelidium occidentale]|nr:hypothetical protein MP638_002073 [Amoeboaphelidium occidentale]
MASAATVTTGLVKQHSEEADELDFLCRKLSDVRVRRNQDNSSRSGIIEEEDVRLSDISDETLQQMVRDMNSNLLDILRKTAIRFRKLLAHEDIQRYLNKIVESGVVPLFVQLLNDFNNPELQFEAAWILTNIAAGTSSQTVHVVECGAVAGLVRLLEESKFKEIKEQAVWCLGNIAGDSAELRKIVLECNAMKPLLKLIEDEMNGFLQSESFFAAIPTQFNHGNAAPQSPSKTHNYNISTLRIALWALSNFCRGVGSSQLDFDLIEVALPILSQVISVCFPGSVHCDDEILMDTCWALSRTLRGIHEGVDKVFVQPDVCQKLGLLIQYQSHEVQIPALRCLINIVSGCDAQTQAVVDAGLLEPLHELLRYPANDTVRKESCLIISNITAGTVEQVQSCIDAGIIPTLVDILWFSDFRTKREACWALSNALLNRNSKQIDYLIVQEKVLKPLFHLIIPQLCHDDRIVIKTLEALKNVLSVGDKVASLLSATSDVEEALLEKLGGMSLDTGKKSGEDSTYGSMTNLFPKKNVYASLFENPICCKGICSLQGPHPSALDVLKLYSNGVRKSDVLYCGQAVSRDVKRLAMEIMLGWF